MAFSFSRALRTAFNWLDTVHDCQIPHTFKERVCTGELHDLETWFKEIRIEFESKDDALQFKIIYYAEIENPDMSLAI